MSVTKVYENKMTEAKTGIADWLRDKVMRTPDKTAVVDPQGQMTFRQLAERADCVSEYLQSRISNTSPVVIFMEKSCQAVAGLTGIILSGNYYCVLDCALPAARLLQLTGELLLNGFANRAADSRFVQKAKSSDRLVILTDAANYEKAESVFAQAGFQVEEIGQILSATVARSETKEATSGRQAVSLTASAATEVADTQKCVTDYEYRPLYCNFTSGSTGIPKGVFISHQNVMDFIPVFCETLGIGEEDILACQAPLDFDISVKDLFTCLYRGTTLVLVPRSYFVNPTLLMDYLEEHRVTTLIWAVSALIFLSVMDVFSYKNLPLLRQVIYSGEVMPVTHLRYLHAYLPQAGFVNVYGPTEITCNCTYHILDETDFDKDEVPVGRAFNGRRVFLLDDNDEVIAVPWAKVGEICVAGEGLALGYLADGLPRLPGADKSWQSIAETGESTDSAFRYRLTSDGYIERIYCTGDLATYDENGELLYRGRADLQIKMYGHRIELPEVEHHANLIGGVIRSCCIFDEKKNRLILYYEGSASDATIREQLLMKLPAYMVPKKLVHTDVLPLNRHGKVDRERLKKETATK